MDRRRALVYSHSHISSLRIPILRILAILAVVSLVALTGCTTIKVKLGMRVYLEKTPVASIAASLPNGAGIAPGEKSPLVVVVTEPNGRVLQTEGKGGGKVLWKDITVTPTLVTANQKGILSLPKDPRSEERRVGKEC